MTPRRLLILLLVVATLLADLAVSRAARDGGQLARALVPALALSQTVLAAAWVACGATALAWRIAAAVALLGAWQSLSAAAGWPGLAPPLALASAACAVGIAICGRLGWRLIDVGGGEQIRTDAAPLASRQFSVAAWFGWMTAVALAISLASSLTASDGLFDRAVAALVAQWASVALAAWVLLDQRVVAGRFFVGAGLVWGTGALASRLLGPGEITRMGAVATYLLLCGSLAVVRVAGFRVALVRDEKNRQSTALAASVGAAQGAIAPVAAAQ